MKFPLAATFGALALVGATAASAQTVIIEPQQEVVIREYVTSQPPMTIDPAIEFDATVGATVPVEVELRPVDVQEVPVQYEYVVVENRTIVVEPGTRRIIHIIE